MIARPCSVFRDFLSISAHDSFVPFYPAGSDNVERNSIGLSVGEDVDTLLIIILIYARGTSSRDSNEPWNGVAV